MNETAESEALNQPADRSAHRASEIDFVKLFLSEQRQLYRFIVSLLGGPQDAEDLLQETASVLWQKLQDFQPGTSFYAWSSKTAYLLVLAHRRRKSRAALVLNDEVLEIIAAQEANDSAKRIDIRASALEQCLQKLSGKDRQLIDRCYSTATTRAARIAEEIGRPAHSVYRSLGRIRRSLLTCVQNLVADGEGVSS